MFPHNYPAMQGDLVWICILLAMFMPLTVFMGYNGVYYTLSPNFTGFLGKYFFTKPSHQIELYSAYSIYCPIWDNRCSGLSCFEQFACLSG